MITPGLHTTSQATRFMAFGMGSPIVPPVFDFSTLNKAGNEQGNISNEKDQMEDKAMEPKAILVVEDTYENQFLANKFLTNAGYVVDIAENGIVAVDKFNKSRYDLILMDIYMPEMDGFEATEKIRSIEKQQGGERIPIIAFTAHAVEGYEQKCLAHDMDDYITKPIKKKDFIKAVQNWV